MAENRPKRPLLDNWSEVSSERAGRTAPDLAANRLPNCGDHVGNAVEVGREDGRQLSSA
jgi:hypothetical protein